MKYRQPAVAGSFYSAEPLILQKQLQEFDHQSDVELIRPKALIVPHAGYVYSGRVAAQAYAYLKPFRDQFKTVILLGPNHRVPLNGCAVTADDAFIMPLGEVPVDQQSRALLIQHGLVQENNMAHFSEHSLEVQLPFLQYYLTEFAILPILVGSPCNRLVTQLLALFAGQPEYLIVISTDLSHFHPDAEAQKIDAASVAQIMACEDSLLPDQACGCYALNGLLHWCHSQHQHDPNSWRIKQVAQTNSAEISQDHQSVVGYASFVIY